MRLLKCYHLLFRTGVEAEEVGRSAATSLLESQTHGGCVDEYLQDQVMKAITMFALPILYMCLKYLVFNPHACLPVCVSVCLSYHLFVC